MKAQIIEELASNKQLKQLAKRIARGDELGADVYQELFVALCEMKSDKLIKAYNENYIIYLCITIMNRMVHSPRHHVNKKLICAELPMLGEWQLDIIEDDEDIEIRAEIEQDELDKNNSVKRYINQRLTQKNFYDVTIFTKWYNGQSYRDIAEETGIPLMSVHESVKRSKIKIGQIYG